MPYTSDLNDKEWAILEPLLVATNKKMGRPRKHDLRSVMNGVLYILCTGAQWRNMPGDLPPWNTVSDQFSRWKYKNIWPQICAIVTRQARISMGRLGDESLLILDTQTIQSAPGNSPRRKKGA